MSFLKKIRTYVCCIVGRLSLQNKFLHFLFTVCIMDLDKIWITMSFFMAKFSLNPWVSISDVPSSSSKTRVSHSLSPAALSSSLSSCPTTKVLDKLSSRSSRDKFWLKRSSTNLWMKSKHIQFGKKTDGRRFKTHSLRMVDGYGNVISMQSSLILGPLHHFCQSVFVESGIQTQDLPF